MLRALLLVFTLVLVAILTVLTQVGGVILLVYIGVAYLLRKRWKWIYKPWSITLCFPLVYLAFTLALLPLVAPLGGRVALPCFSGNLRPLSLGTCVCNRHYVVPQLKAVAEDAASEMHKLAPTNKLYYLDANFPFLDGFPLIPHLSHNDGRKMDLAFYYKDAQTDNPVDGAPSVIGYGVFEGPKKGEPDKPKECAQQGQWQYSYMERIISQGKATRMVFDDKRTKQLLWLLAKDGRIKKMFLEPHLKQRLGLMGFAKIRYQGCHSVRHDDHVHVQL